MSFFDRRSRHRASCPSGTAPCSEEETLACFRGDCVEPNYPRAECPVDSGWTYEPKSRHCFYLGAGRANRPGTRS